MAATRLIITGDLSARTFAPWVIRHLHRLGLAGHIARHDAARMDLDVEGPPDLIDAMEIGVSLGPIDAWVDSIRRLPLNRT